MTSLETLNTKVSANALRFPLVTHMIYSDARFDSYEILKSGQGAEILSRQTRQTGELSGFEAEDVRNMARVVCKFRRPLTHLSNAYSYTHFQ
jgi:hypothetical protein